MEWKNIYRGVFMGISDIVPGVSGGTIAVLLGIYDRLIESITGLFSAEWKRHLQFLLPLGIGAALAIFSFSHLMDWLLANYSRPTFYLFIGLILGSLPYLFKESDLRDKMENKKYAALLVIGIVLINLLPVDPNGGAVIDERSFGMYLLLFLSGFLASAAMILPGISGSFVLLVLGIYHTIIHALTELEIPVIIVVGAGIAIGILTMSKVINYFFKKFRLETFSLIIGLVIGSVILIARKAGYASTPSEFALSLFVFFIGIFIALSLGAAKVAND
ncbi:MAG TPA: DUF368 domain-containing protein [Pseudogracilibacillus sp.]|nr:DUF368 domain-containing protein [Pseudogracilibacillus sp.]